MERMCEFPTALRVRLHVLYSMPNRYMGSDMGRVVVPFEEDDKDPSVWFLDHNYVESMNDMFKKVNAREKLIGWYHSGPKLRASDLEINELFKRYTPNPLLVIIDVQPKEAGVPTDAYFAVEEIKDVCCDPPVDNPIVLTTITGWYDYIQDFRTHSIYNRSRGGRRDRSGASSPRYSGCCSWHTLYTNNIATSISTRLTFTVTGYWPILGKGY
jgi:proteasome lid subunit RPN8/RPN11